MYEIEVNKGIYQIVKIFQLFGMWQIEDNPNSCGKFLWKSLYLLFHLLFVISVASAGLLSDDRNESIFLFSASLAVFVGTVRLSLILFKQEEIRKLIKEIGTHAVTDSKEFVDVNTKVNNLMKFSFSLFLFMCVTRGILFASCLPIFSSEKKLPMNIWFPLDWKNNLTVYWIAYVFELVGVIISVVGVLLNTLVWYLMMNSAIKYQILGNQFRNMFLPKLTIDQIKISNEEQEKFYLQELIGLIRTHHNIQKTVDRFKSCFGNLFFAQITTSGICICATVYSLAFSAKDGNFIPMLKNTVMLYIIFDTFMVMNLGTSMKLSSDRLSYSLFESNWFERSKSCKKCIIVSTEVLKKPHELLIAKIYPLDMNTFVSIVKLAYSMFNILKNLN